jgi:hypothetical protein
MNIPIYKAEIDAGLQESIEASASVAFFAPVQTYAPDQNQEDKAQALMLLETEAQSNPDQFDLYYLNSVLVSTGWNKNDDVFDIKETWKARKTPEDKPFNFMHNEKDIIGHITANIAVDSNGLQIPDDTAEENLPDKFDIVTSSVIYNSWSDTETKDRISNMISEIEGGKWYVSMECLFSNFDYAVVTPQGENKVVARDENSAFLTKHLRTYGGTGQYDGYTVGRLLRSISFSGKGLVSKPANPRSIIITDSDPFESVKAYSITASQLNDKEISNMSDLLQKQVEELKAQLAEADEAKQALEAEISGQKDEEFRVKTEAFEAAIQSNEEKIAQLNEEFSGAKSQVTELEESLAKKDEELATANEKIEAHEVEKKLLARKSLLLEAGLEGEEAEAAIERFAEASDEMFEEIVTLIAMKKKGALPPWLKKDKDKDEDEDEDEKKKKDAKSEEATEADEATEEETDEAEAEAEAEILEEAEVDSDVALADAGDDAVEAARTSASNWLETNVLRTTANLNE